MSDLEQARRDLGYIREWRSSGLVSDELLAAQHAHFLGPEGDRNGTELYRVAALRQALNERTSLTAFEFEAFLKAGRAEVRIGGICRNLTGMGENVFFELAGWRGLSKAQFDRLATLPLGRAFRRQHRRIAAFRHLEKDPSDRSRIEAIPALEGDPTARNKLIDRFREHLPEDILQMFTESGNRRQRHLAREELRRRVAEEKRAGRN